MKAVILAGGLGSRISEESSLRPKPMIEIGGRPILLHIMKIYAAHDANDFLLCHLYQTDIEGERVKGFVEKPAGDGGFINGGFFVLQPQVFRYLKADSDIWEHGPLESLAREGQLRAYHHDGFWQPMDTLRDKNVLEELWS